MSKFLYLLLNLHLSVIWMCLFVKFGVIKAAIVHRNH